MESIDNCVSSEVSTQAGCYICLDQFAQEELATLPCGGHRSCRLCITTLFREAFKCEISYPPSCCPEVPNIPLSSVEHLLDSDFVQDCKYKQVEYNTDHPLRLYCANLECSTFLPRDPGQDITIKSEIRCTKCDAATCTACKEIFTTDSPHTCNHSPRDFGFSPFNRCKTCPYCSTPIQLIDACNHITCKVCHYDFCFVCLQWYYPPEGIGHDCPSYGDPEYDENGYDIRGFHRDTGLDCEGYDLAGFNREGVDRNGVKRPFDPAPGPKPGWTGQADDDGWGAPPGNAPPHWRWDDEEFHEAGLNEDDFEEDRIMRAITALELGLVDADWNGPLESWTPADDGQGEEPVLGAGQNADDELPELVTFTIEHYDGSERHDEENDDHTADPDHLPSAPPE
ncbi:hypothetical protein H2201_008099 [Coniosporium apollinis]|uniref:RING-type domain-containing protein n=2 Tax=Coniosporium TaxID=2810619 RepID=A0ABQ9NHW3_9PEZI|nr:hypothetical protein H2199_003827 [Cladosporium sp. JES 115]KAJ9657693.1 hypothetical protein H2201_008099 [Coniosporium apollinis]